MLVGLETCRVKRKRRRGKGERARTGLKVKILMVTSFCSMNHQGVLLLSPGWGAISLQGYQGYHHQYAISRVVKSSRLPVKIAAYLISIGWLLCLSFLYGWCFLHKISLDWTLTLTTQTSTSKPYDLTTLRQYPFRYMGEERESQAKFLVSENATPILGLNLDVTGLMLKVSTAWPPNLHLLNRARKIPFR